MADYIEITVRDVTLRYYDEERIERRINGDWRAMKQSSNSYGYKVIRIGRKQSKVHRVVFYAHNPDWDFENSSNDNSIDHINGIKNDNRIENLRVATHQQNAQNQVNARGTSFTKSRQKWRATIKANGKLNHLGYFATEQLAHEAYLIAKPIYHTARE